MGTHKSSTSMAIDQMLGGIFGAKIIGIFDLEKNFELAFYPLIAAMGGNVEFNLPL